MLRAITRALKKLPIDFGQYEVRYTTKGKLIAYDLVPLGKGTALDLGCRDGYWSRKLNEKGYQVVAADLEPCYAPARQIDANEPLPFSDESFDVVWFSEVIEHLRRPDAATAELKRVLRPGGRLFVTTPNKQFWVYSLLEKCGARQSLFCHEGHFHFFSYADMKRLFPGAEFYGFFFYVFAKFRIRKLARLLSPTIVLEYRKS